MTESASERVRRVHRALSLLTPYDIAGKMKTRIGRSGDGGYVLLTRPKLPDAVYSFGVGDDISFEHGLAKRGCRCHLFDHAVDRLPREHPNLRFLQASVGVAKNFERSVASVGDYL